MSPADQTAALQRAVREAFEQGRRLRIVGGGTKDFYGRDTSAAGHEPLSLLAQRGILAYEPTELVLTARAGTPLGEIEDTLAERGQHLPFEPPSFDPSPGAAGSKGATLGGAVASGLAGPRRAYAGAVRDFVLGLRLINGRGDDLRFGGQVMKNVAGYDVSRLMAGSLGTLAVLTEISLKVLPRPVLECTLGFELDAPQALAQMARWARRPLPIAGTLHQDGCLLVRLAGSRAGVEAACRELGGEPCADDGVWKAVRDHRTPFFREEGPLWRLALPDGTPDLAAGPAQGAALPEPATTVIEWGGTQRWVRTTATASAVRALAARHGGHATAFRGGDRTGEVFHPLPGTIAALHRRLKAAFDPAGILNPGRLYPDL